MSNLLDTSIVSDLIRNPNGRIAAPVREVGEAVVSSSIIVAAQLRFEAAKEGSPRLTAQLEAVLGALEILPFEAPADTIYAEIRWEHERTSGPIGGNAPLIAAQARALGRTIVTDNEREFVRVVNLPRENGLR